MFLIQFVDEDYYEMTSRQGGATQGYNNKSLCSWSADGSSAFVNVFMKNVAVCDKIELYLWVN